MEKLCKYCGEYKGYLRHGVCDRCHHKLPAVKQFAIIRDQIRVSVGLEPLKLTENTKDENTCSMIL